MEQRKQAVKYVANQGLSVTKALAIAGISRSSYYYKPTGRRKGKACSAHTRAASGQLITNHQVVEIIQQLLSQEFIDYGYKRTAHALKRDGWMINVKKVYRLMKEHHLLYPARKRRQIDKTYVKHTKPRPLYPFHILEVDIKYVWLHWQRRHAYLVTFLCVKTRFAIGWELDLSMKSSQIVQLLEDVLLDPLVLALAGSSEHSLRIRSDNGPQFIARTLAEVCSQRGLHHEFIQPGTPQQNGHIEGFHSTVERLVCQPYELRLIEDAKKTFERFYTVYNYQRIMASVGYKTPYEVLSEWATTHGKQLPVPASIKSSCIQTKIQPTLPLNNHQSDLSSL